MNYKKLGRRSNIINTSYMDRHFKWGANLKMIDIDSVEFDKNHEPVVMFETKHGSITKIDLADSQFRQLRTMANRLVIPAFCTVYYIPGLNEYNNVTNEFGDKHNFYVIPINNLARTYLLNGQPMKMTELDYVKWICKIKNEQFSPTTLLDNEWNNNIKLPTILSSDIGTAYWEHFPTLNRSEWTSRLY